jgi:hypothetical protein
MDIFDEISEQFGEETKPLTKGEKPAKEYIPTAYQLIRVTKKFSFGEWKYERQILDTIAVENGRTESAKNRAVEKARLHGNCIVIELCERSVITIDERELNGTILYKDGRKHLARVRNR